MKESVLKYVSLCKHCHKAFQDGIEGENEVCDACADTLAESTTEDEKSVE